MSNLTEEQLQSYYSRIHKNDREILNSDVCSCIFCRQTYSARDVCDWIQNDDGTLNAVCPICGMETVIGDRKQGRIEHDELRQINLRFFGENYMEEHPEALRKYVTRYNDGEITHKQPNETLYIHYLTILADKDDAYATYMLGCLYMHGAEWTKKDPQLALSLFTKPQLATYSKALVQVGQLLQSGDLKFVDHQKAFEYYSKAMALSSNLAILKLADCYFYGLGVDYDCELAVRIYNNLWSYLYPLWIKSKGKEYSLFGDVCERIGESFERGWGNDQSDDDALRNYIIASYAFSLRNQNHPFEGDINRNPEAVRGKIASLGLKLGYTRNAPVGLIDTLMDSVLSGEGYMPDDQKYILHIDDYDEGSEELRFSIHSESSQFIVDVDDLFAGFVPGHTSWLICGKIIEAAEGDNEFDMIGIDGKDIKFIKTGDGNDNIILHFELSDDMSSPEEEIEPIKENLA